MRVRPSKTGRTYDSLQTLRESDEKLSRHSTYIRTKIHTYVRAYMPT